MIECSILKSDGLYHKAYAYTLREFQEVELPQYDLIKKSRYLNGFATFDIESSVLKNDLKSIIEDRDCYDGFMYQWQLCIGYKVVFGNTIEELIELFNHISKYYQLDSKRKLVIYVHNLSFEYFFIKDFMNFTEIFSYDTRHVIKAVNEFYEFRCSYTLSNMNLSKYIENSGGSHIKAKGDLDYSVVRTPHNHKLTAIEYGYCYNDVYGLYEALSKSLEADDIKSIPLTNTGYVRRDCRNSMRRDKKNRYRFQRTKLNERQYTIVNEAFRGGNTGSNRYNTGYIISGVSSEDISSSYPFVMMTELYPVGKLIEFRITTAEQLAEYNKKYCTFGRYSFYNIRCKEDTPIAYIPLSKCNDFNMDDDLLNYNGRILSASYINITLTNVDFDIILDQYEFESVEVSDYYVSQKGKLPKELRENIMKYFKNKSLLKYDDSKQYEYRKAKAMLNSMYGLCATRPLRDTYVLEDGEIVLSEDKDTLDDYYNKWSSFLSYQVAPFITAYARRNLERGIRAVGCNDVIYCDTDSVYYKGNHKEAFEKINDDIMSAFDPEDISVTAEDGRVYWLGVWDLEQNGDNRFITLGAKKYAIEKDGHIKITVSGLSKTLGGKELEQIGGLEQFKIGTIFYNSGRTIAQYNDHEGVHQITVNGDTFTTSSNIAIIPTTYTLGITNTMLEILQMYSLEEISKMLK